MDSENKISDKETLDNIEKKAEEKAKNIETSPGKITEKY